MLWGIGVYGKLQDTVQYKSLNVLHNAALWHTGTGHITGNISDQMGGCLGPFVGLIYNKKNVKYCQHYLFRCNTEQNKWPYHFGTEFGGEYVAYSSEKQHVEFLVQAEEVAEGKDDHLFGMSIQPLSYLFQNGLEGKHDTV